MNDKEERHLCDIKVCWEKYYYNSKSLSKLKKNILFCYYAFIFTILLNVFDLFKFGFVIHFMILI